jgi:cytochrome c peroxidase
MTTLKGIFMFISVLAGAVFVLSSHTRNTDNAYLTFYHQKIGEFNEQQSQLLKSIDQARMDSPDDIKRVISQIEGARASLKAADFWLRYLEPISYKKINGPLPVEWETEVFEKFEKPYKREGAGLTLARMYLDEADPGQDSLYNLIHQSIEASKTFSSDSTTEPLKTYHHFYLCNRLFLLNLASIYTTGFECPDTEKVIVELRGMLMEVNQLYTAFNESFPANSLTDEYLSLYRKAIIFTERQPVDFTKFDHFTFISVYVNPLFSVNQKLIREYRVVSRSLMDYSLNKTSTTIFDKALYHGQNPKGIFIRVKEPEALAQLDKIGKLLFYDPILSGNNSRSCASCHKPKQYFTDTLARTSLQFDHMGTLPRNTPSLINVQYNHLLMLDGKHISLQDQTKAVMFDPIEMGSDQVEVLKKVLSCEEYRSAFTDLLKFTPQEKEITIDHIASAITFYYAKFSNAYAPFDEAMNGREHPDPAVQRGFNLFSSKAQCATCHFVPQFNGVKPPYVGSEFEVLGVPENNDNKNVSPDKGRFGVNEAFETLHAFRTGTLRNSKFTKPYMHNGVFKSLRDVIDFYDAGGGAGRGMNLANQTLSSDSLHLTDAEKNDLIRFIESLNEKISFEEDPESLPLSENQNLNGRKVGGLY